MALHTINPTQTKAWEKLQNHFAALQSVTMQELFLKDANRAEQFNIIWNDFLLDYSKNNIDKETIQLLVELANECGLQSAISDYLRNVRNSSNYRHIELALQSLLNNFHM